MSFNNFNFVAPIYDHLVSLVFGNKLLAAQSHFLTGLPAGKRVLLVGGGTGKVLRHAFFKSAYQIDYVELSEAMLKRAKMNGKHLLKVEYLAQDFFETNGDYDIVICNFFLDCFDEFFLSKAVEHLKHLSAPKAKVIVTDFRNTEFRRHRILIYLMVFFFTVFARLQSKRLLDINEFMLEHFELLAFKSKQGSLVYSAVYQPAELVND